MQCGKLAMVEKNSIPLLANFEILFPSVHWLEVQHIEGYPVVFKPVLESNLKSSNPIKINLECLFIYL